MPSHEEKAELIIIPFSPANDSVAREQAELRQGLALFIRKVVHKLRSLRAVISYDHEQTEAWSGKYMLKGSIDWDDYGVSISLEVRETETDNIILHYYQNETSDSAARCFLEFVGRLMHLLSDKEEYGRISTLHSTRNSKAFRYYLCGLAAEDNWRIGLVSVDRSLNYLYQSISADNNFFEASLLFEDLAFECLIKNEELKAVEHYLEKVIEVLPYNPYTNALLGLVLEQSGKSDRAIKKLNYAAKELRRGQLASMVMQQLARHHFHQFDLIKAKKLSQAALRAKQDNVDAWNLLADIYKQLKCVTEMKECLVKSLRINEEQPSTLLKYALSIARSGDSNYLNITTSALSGSGLTTEERVIGIQNLIDNGFFDVAEGLLIDWLEEKESYVYWLELSKLHFKRSGECNEEVNYCVERAKKTSKNFVDYLRVSQTEADLTPNIENLFTMHSQLYSEKPSERVPLIQKALRIMPAHLPYHVLLIDELIELGNLNEAQSALENVQDLYGLAPDVSKRLTKELKRLESETVHSKQTETQQETPSKDQEESNLYNRIVRSISNWMR